MTRIVEDLCDGKGDMSLSTLVPPIISDSLIMSLPRQAALGTASAAAGITAALVPPAAPIIAPVAAIAFLAAWAYGIYKKT